MQVTDIRTDARYLVSPQLTSTDYPDVDLDRNVNRWYRTIFAWAIEAQGDWELNGDILTQDLQASTTDYAIPSTLISIYKAEVLYTTGGSYVPVKMISVKNNQDVSEGNSTRTFDDVNYPTMEVFGDFLQLKPAPTATVVNGLMIYAQLDFTDLDSVNNNVPDLMEPVQRILSIGGAYDYCVSNEMWSKAAELKRIIFGDTRVPNDGGLKQIVFNLYSMRNAGRRDQVRAKRQSYR